MTNISRFANDAHKPFHSSGYAEAANGSSMGAASAESFQKRQRMEQNRQIIQSYRDSHIARGSDFRQELNRRLNSTDVNTNATDDPHHKRKFNRQAFNAGGGASEAPTPPSAKVTPPPRRSFSEPPSRGYNPFG